ncbi:MAG TPA: molybdopterin-synthase adenylyltransferase MoeB [Cyclobacteriaceae bacterium]|nr:molybdopterin-synthase adenylyltransferase MoeB [Cyclobacteriaceae bacterium]
MLTAQELQRYSRQILLSELGQEGQQKLKGGSILVIGAGGLGSPALYYLAAAGVGRIGIVDFDIVDVSNLQRQILFTSEDVGKSKAAMARQRLEKLNPLIKIEVHECVLNSQNAMNILVNYDVVIDGSDNLPTRYLVNDACVLLGKTLIYGAIFQFEGQVSVFNELLKDRSRGPNYRDLFPEPPPPEMVPSCSVGGVLGVLPGIIGSMQANEAIKVLAGIGTTLSGRLLLFDSLDFTTRFVNLKPNPDNPVSGKNPTIQALIDYEAFCNPAYHTTVKEISAPEVKKMLDDKIAFQLIDVREPQEFEFVNIGGVNIPMNDIEKKISMIKRDIPVVIHCKSGARSLLAIEKLKQHGFTNLLNMKGGIIQWIDEVNPELTKY